MLIRSSYRDVSLFWNTFPICIRNVSSVKLFELQLTESQWPEDISGNSDEYSRYKRTLQVYQNINYMPRSSYHRYIFICVDRRWKSSRGFLLRNKLFRFRGFLSKKRPHHADPFVLSIVSVSIWNNTGRIHNNGKNSHTKIQYARYFCRACVEYILGNKVTLKCVNPSVGPLHNIFIRALSQKNIIIFYILLVYFIFSDILISERKENAKILLLILTMPQRRYNV